MIGGCGPSSTESFSWFDPDTCSWRTSQVSFLPMGGTPCPKYSGTWPQAGTMQNGRVYQRRQLVPRTFGTGSSSWRTPGVMDCFGPIKRKGKKLKGRSSTDPQVGLADQVQVWPTPRAQERCQQNSQDSGMALSKAVKLWPTPTKDAANERNNLYAQGGQSLSCAVRRWPTPRAHEVGAYQYSRGDHNKKVLTLTGAARRWPTPAARDHKGPGFSGQLPNVVSGGELNPVWVEWLMGFPAEWTELQHSETP